MLQLAPQSVTISRVIGASCNSDLCRFETRYFYFNGSKISFSGTNRRIIVKVKSIFFWVHLVLKLDFNKLKPLSHIYWGYLSKQACSIENEIRYIFCCLCCCFCCCKTFRKPQHNPGPCRTFVAKYITNGNAKFDVSVPVLVGWGRCELSNCFVLNQILWFEDTSVFERYNFAERIWRSLQHVLYDGKPNIFSWHWLC